jgi:hypothetical protein
MEKAAAATQQTARSHTTYLEAQLRTAWTAAHRSAADAATLQAAQLQQQHKVSLVDACLLAVVGPSCRFQEFPDLSDWASDLFARYASSNSSSSSSGTGQGKRTVVELPGFRVHHPPLQHGEWEGSPVTTAVLVCSTAAVRSVLLHSRIRGAICRSHSLWLEELLPAWELAARFPHCGGDLCAAMELGGSLTWTAAQSPRVDGLRSPGEWFDQWDMPEEGSVYPPLPPAHWAPEFGQADALPASYAAPRTTTATAGASSSHSRRQQPTASSRQPPATHMETSTASGSSGRPGQASGLQGDHAALLQLQGQPRWWHRQQHTHPSRPGQHQQACSGPPHAGILGEATRTGQLHLVPTSNRFRGLEEEEPPRGPRQGAAAAARQAATAAVQGLGAARQPGGGHKGDRTGALAAAVNTSKPPSSVVSDSRPPTANGGQQRSGAARPQGASAVSGNISNGDLASPQQPVATAQGSPEEAVKALQEQLAALTVTEQAERRAAEQRQQEIITHAVAVAAAGASGRAEGAGEQRSAVGAASQPATAQERQHSAGAAVSSGWGPGGAVGGGEQQLQPPGPSAPPVAQPSGTTTRRGGHGGRQGRSRSRSRSPYPRPAGGRGGGGGRTCPPQRCPPGPPPPGQQAPAPAAHQGRPQAQQQAPQQQQVPPPAEAAPAGGPVLGQQAGLEPMEA